MGPPHHADGTQTENLGEHLHSMFRAIRRIVDEFYDVKVIYLVHLNPAVRSAAKEVLGDHERVKLTDPMEVIDFHNFLARSYMILTDSGGIQGGSPILGKTGSRNARYHRKA